MKMTDYIDMGEQYILHTYNRFPVVFEKGDGVYLYDVNQKPYLDFAAGIAVFALGYHNKAYNDALKDQVQAQLEALAADGTLAKISEKWFDKDITTIGK